ncbi:sirohydrochlorin chelatase [Mycobacterium sp. 1274761.0]|uniref:sirohydrochlorin chelatase n=1 Tax=Mycobacterium sp. 1274761.0 TaxID=1834077 RepID=UPI0007FD59CF|nr:sirohydrochlorin chelatase [Mycobacterium sp. 1274761.0]OBK72333.1 sirohydrochlorin ferrochelatase [Mycobacterium sp. 1274761.0]
MRVARFVNSLVLTAHGSADPRSAANARAIGACVRELRPSLDVRVAFCEQNFPNLREVLPTVPTRAVVVPLLLADAYHARVDIPVMIAESGADAHRAGVLGEDDRLIHVLRQRLEQAGVSRLDSRVGVLVTAVGSSNPAANARTETVARELTLTTRWSATTAFATGPQPNLSQAARLLRQRGAERLVVAPWFLAHGTIIDRVADFARSQGIPMSSPLGAHRQVAETVLDRFDAVVAARTAA